MADLPDDITSPLGDGDRIRDRIREQAQDDGDGDFGTKWSKLESKLDGDGDGTPLVHEKIEFESTAADGKLVDDITQGTTIGPDALKSGDSLKAGDSLKSGDDVDMKLLEGPGDAYTAADKAHKGGTPLVDDSNDSAYQDVTFTQAGDPADPVGDLLPPLEDAPGGDSYETVTLSVEDDADLGNDLDGV